MIITHTGAVTVGFGRPSANTWQPTVVAGHGEAWSAIAGGSAAHSSGHFGHSKRMAAWREESNPASILARLNRLLLSPMTQACAEAGAHVPSAPWKHGTAQNPHCPPPIPTAPPLTGTGVRAPQGQIR